MGRAVQIRIRKIKRRKKKGNPNKCPNCGKFTKKK